MIPALAESTSKRSLELLFDYVGSLEMDHDVQIEPVALVANRVEHTNQATAMLEWFDQALPDVPLFEIRKRVALQRAFEAGSSVFAVEEDVDMQAEFKTMADTIETRVQRHEVPA